MINFFKTFKTLSRKAFCQEASSLNRIATKLCSKEAFSETFPFVEAFFLCRSDRAAKFHDFMTFVQMNLTRMFCSILFCLVELKRQLLSVTEDLSFMSPNLKFDFQISFFFSCQI